MRLDRIKKWRGWLKKLGNVVFVELVFVDIDVEDVVLGILLNVGILYEDCFVVEMVCIRRCKEGNLK